MRRTLRSWNTIFAKLGFSAQTVQKRSQRLYSARRLRMEQLEDRSMLATVTTHLDIIDPNDGRTSLREAIINTVEGVACSPKADPCVMRV